MPHTIACDKCGLSEREIEIGTMTSALGNLIAVCPTCAQFERNKIRSDADLGKRVEVLLADRLALRKRVDALETALDQAIGYLEHFTSQPDHSDEAEQHVIIVEGDIERFKALVVEGK